MAVPPAARPSVPAEPAAALPPMLRRALRAGVCLVLCVSAAACGGGHGGALSPGAPAANDDNVAAVVVDGGPAQRDVNTLFTSVTVCVPGSTSSCQTIDHIQVDTASFGLRILAPALTLSLPVQKAANGDSLVECTAFVDGFSWGPVALADVRIAGESASSTPIQIIGDPRFTSIPADCSGVGPEEDTVAEFGANGILGIGVFAQDCGSGCADTAANMLYYACNSAQCEQTAVPLSTQVPNPVTLFAADNNGTLIELPGVAAPGAATVTGSLIFGVDTRSNNQSGSETVLTVDPAQGLFTTVFDGQSLAMSITDTGSNAFYFNDSSLTPCAGANFSGFYCPANTESFTAVLQGRNSITADVSFTVGNAQTMATANPTFTALPTLAGTFPTAGTFDWGLPFYFGRRVATVLEGRTTSAGTGPYIAF